MTTIKAVIRNENHPEYGTVTIPMPIPIKEYDHVLKLLAPLEVGGALERDCYIQDICDSLPILQRLKNSSVNLDELDYLAKRIDGFCDSEYIEFQGAAYTKGVYQIQDFINLTECYNQATVVEDFRDLTAIGKEHFMKRNGGAVPIEIWKSWNFKQEAYKLLTEGKGKITPYGVVYENGMELKQHYVGGLLPEYLYDSIAIVNTCTNNGKGFNLFLPMADSRLQRELLRAGADKSENLPLLQIDWFLPEENDCLSNLKVDSIFDLNHVCNILYKMDPSQIKDVREIIASICSIVPQIECPEEAPGITEADVETEPFESQEINFY